MYLIETVVLFNGDWLLGGGTFLFGLAAVITIINIIINQKKAHLRKIEIEQNTYRDMEVNLERYHQGVDRLKNEKGGQEIGRAKTKRAVFIAREAINEYDRINKLRADEHIVTLSAGQAGIVGLREFVDANKHIFR